MDVSIVSGHGKRYVRNGKGPARPLTVKEWARQREWSASSPKRPHGVTIGVVGMTHDIPALHLQRAFELGRAIGIAGGMLVTGACHGTPLAAAEGAHREGALVIGVSPGMSLAEHTLKYGSPVEHHDVLVFTGSGLMGREVVNIRTSEMVVVAGGHAGTLGELAIAYVEGKIIGVLMGLGGASKIVRQILRTCHNDDGPPVLYDHDPHRLVNRMMTLYRERRRSRTRSLAASLKQAF